MEKPEKYIKKPLEIEAIQFLSDNIDAVSKFIGEFPHRVIRSEQMIVISTLEGDHLVRHGDFVIRGVYDEYYPCKPEIFTSTYSKVEETSNL